MESLSEMESDLSQLQWDVVALRMTAFPAPGTNISVSGWWETIVGEAPEQVTVKPRTGEFFEHGNLENGLFELKINPSSVTWIHRADDLQLENDSESLGELVSTCEEFCIKMNKWFELEAVPNLIRLAFGANLVQPVENQQMGLERVSKYIPAVSLDFANSIDFLYQINRRRPSESEFLDLEINRLTKWSVIQRQLFHINPALGGDAVARPPRDFVQLELDINSVQEFEGELGQSQLPSLFEELVSLGKEIAAEGDIP